MSSEEEIRRLEAELEFVQNEINRRHERVDNDIERARNMEKIDALREKKNKLQGRIAELKED